MGWLLLFILVMLGYLLSQRVSKSSPSNSYTQPLTRQQALDVLGLTPDASQDDIITAHRALIQKVHPDAGGTQSLAQLVNHAKDVLLNP